MHTHYQDLISTMDTAKRATAGLNHIETKVVDLMAGADTKEACSEILQIISITRDAISLDAHESLIRLRQLL